MTESVLHQQLLDNGLELIFCDLSNRYYGDFYQIKIDVISRLPLSEQLLSESGLSEIEKLWAKNRFVDVFETHQELKRMGVAGPDVANVTKQMIRQFLESSLPYISDSEFPSRLLRKGLSERPQLRSIDG